MVAERRGMDWSALNFMIHVKKEEQKNGYTIKQNKKD